MSKAVQQKKSLIFRGPAVEWLAGLAALVVGLLLLWAIHKGQSANSSPRGSVPQSSPVKPATPQPPLQWRLLLPC